jgi:hypothetical protein
VRPLNNSGSCWWLCCETEKLLRPQTPSKPFPSHITLKILDFPRLGKDRHGFFAEISSSVLELGGAGSFGSPGCCLKCHLRSAWNYPTLSLQESCLHGITEGLGQSQLECYMLAETFICWPRSSFNFKKECSPALKLGCWWRESPAQTSSAILSSLYCGTPLQQPRTLGLCRFSWTQTGQLGGQLSYWPLPMFASPDFYLILVCPSNSQVRFCYKASPPPPGNFPWGCKSLKKIASSLLKSRINMQLKFSEHWLWTH